MQSQTHLPIKELSSCPKKIPSKTGSCFAERQIQDEQSELGQQGGGSHLESVLQVLGFQAVPLGELRVRAAGERRHALLLRRSFSLRSKGWKHFQFPTWEKVSNLSLSTLANVQGELQLC